MSIITEALKKAQHKTIDKRLPADEKTHNLNAPLFLGIILMLFIAIGVVLVSTGIKKRPLEIAVENRPEASMLTPSIKPAPKAIPETTLAGPEEIEEKPGWETNYSTTPSAQHFEVNLSGIMYTPKKPLAVINDRIVAEGETIGPFKIIRIDRDKVVLNASDGTELVVSLKK